jgi:hypothetical protein
VFSSSPSKSFNSPKQTSSTTIEPTNKVSPVFVVIRARIRTITAIPGTALITPWSRRFGTAPCSHEPQKLQKGQLTKPAIALIDLSMSDISLTTTGHVVAQQPRMQNRQPSASALSLGYQTNALPFGTERKGITVVSISLRRHPTACRTPRCFRTSCPADRFHSL